MGIALVIEAFLAMRRELPRMKLVLVGDGPARAEIEAEHTEPVFAGLRRARTWRGTARRGTSSCSEA